MAAANIGHKFFTFSQFPQQPLLCCLQFSIQGHALRQPHSEWGLLSSFRLKCVSTPTYASCTQSASHSFSIFPK